VTDAWDDEDRAIARALGVDAPESDAETTINAEVVAEYETVLSQLPFDAVTPRAELEDQVVAAALERRTAAARAIEGGRSPARRSAAPRVVAIGATVAVAAALVVVLLIGRPGGSPGSPGGSIAPAASTGSVTQVLAEPDSRTGVLRSATGATVGHVALGSDGQGYLYDLTLPKPAEPDQQWLWLDTTSGPVLVGSMATGPTVHFVVRGDLDAIDGVFVTTEKSRPRAPGSVSSRADLAPVS
jgi:hypothetical protein